MNNFNTFSRKYQDGQRSLILPLCPGTIISLLDIMREISVEMLAAWLHTIQDFLMEMDRAPGALLSKKRAIRVRTQMEHFEKFCDDLECDEVNHRLFNVLMVLSGGDINLNGKSKTNRPLAESTKHALTELKDAINLEVAKCRFVVVDNAKWEFLEPGSSYIQGAVNLFGENVSKNFPSANKDIKEAGNCLALNLNSAAVFHLMRVVGPAIPLLQMRNLLFGGAAHARRNHRDSQSGGSCQPAG